MHECRLKNDELNQEIIISEETLWVYDSQGEFIGDFDITFCPLCGKHLRPERSKREDMEGLNHLPDKGWLDKNAGFP